MRGIHWFRYDLRLHDNPALTRLAESCDELLCVSIWLFFELLWREYYQWLHVKYQSRFYQKRGIRNIDPALHSNPTAFSSWKQGNTDSEFVNAFMRQLMQTGWMSNRGRQIVASYLNPIIPFVSRNFFNWKELLSMTYG